MTEVGNGNLIPNSQRTPSELREQTRKGGIASGVARRKKKQIKEIAELIGSLKVREGELDDILDDDSLTTLLTKNLTTDEIVVLKISQKAKDGDLNATKLYMEMRGVSDKADINIMGESINRIEIVTRSSKEVVDEDYELLQEIADGHGIPLPPKEELYEAKRLK